MRENHIAIEVSIDEHYATPYLKSLKENWPSLARDYRHFCHVTSPQTGALWAWTSPEGQKFFHLVLDEKTTDSHPHNLVNADRLKSFKQALKELKKVMESEKIETVELPKIGFHFSDREFELALMMLKDTFLDTSAEVRFV